MDQKARLYTTKVASRLWSLQVFYNVLDLAGINSVIGYNEVTVDKITRRDYLLKVIFELVNIANPDHGDEEEGTEGEPVPTTRFLGGYFLAAEAGTLGDDPDESTHNQGSGGPYTRHSKGCLDVWMMCPGELRSAPGVAGLGTS